MPHQKIDIEIKIAEIFSTALKRKIEVTDEIIRDNEAGWDSLVNLEIVMGIEEIFDVRLSTEEIESFKSKSSITRILLEIHGTM